MLYLIIRVFRLQQDGRQNIVNLLKAIYLSSTKTAKAQWGLKTIIIILKICLLRNEIASTLTLLSLRLRDLKIIAYFDIIPNKCAEK